MRNAGNTAVSRRSQGRFAKACQRKPVKILSRICRRAAGPANSKMASVGQVIGHAVDGECSAGRGRGSAVVR